MIEAKVPAVVDAVGEELNASMAVQELLAAGEEIFLIISIEKAEDKWKGAVAIVEKQAKFADGFCHRSVSRIITINLRLVTSK